MSRDDRRLLRYASVVGRQCQCSRPHRRPLSGKLEAVAVEDDVGSAFKNVLCLIGSIKKKTRRETTMSKKTQPMPLSIACLLQIAGSFAVRMKSLLWLVFIVTSFPFHALAGVDDCKSALVLSTYARTEDRFHDARMATHVSESEYSDIRRKAGGSAVIYGVPVGANYSDFNQRANARENSSGSSLTNTEAINVMWTGIDQTSQTAYADCLATLAATLPGIHLSVKSASATDVVILAHYVPVGSNPSSLHVKWSAFEYSKTAFPDEIPAGQTLILLKRPSKSLQLVVNASAIGSSDGVEINPLPLVVLPTPVPPPPVDIPESRFRVHADTPPPPCDSAGSPLPARVPTHLRGLYNLALLDTASASASSIIPGYPARHQIRFLNDGWFNNCRSWIPQTMPAWAQVDLGDNYLISLIIFGSEYQQFYRDRRPTNFAIDLSKSGSPGSWTTVYQSGPGEIVSDMREFPISPNIARFVRVTITDSQGGAPRIDELQVYGKPVPSAAK
ncbi:F5/8 type C domain protein [Caballeronia calidae]|uniref:F5/8 type C domain protein n=2 Tax=Caballeronia calidae TaxID=1777139 RepID=A0A158CJ04_9BURK|nr:F5/8 type C domain protein [Caballeronia calidae]